MADVIKKSTNRWSKGLVMDFSPENTNNEVLTHALNATLLTFNGNELSLQNDMGNARVETAYLPEGYIPVGTCEYGGIIYIVSYNPLEDKSQIGCFPSPERNVSNTELGIANVMINNSDFVDTDGNIKNNSKHVLLRNDNLNPGDKFIVYANSNIFNEQLSGLMNGSEYIQNPILALNIVSIEDSGKITYLNSTLRQYENGNYKYHIAVKSPNSTIEADIDSYRNTLSSGYNIFRSKTSGKLAILAELIMIDSYSVTHSIKSSEEEVKGAFDIIIHTEISPDCVDNNPKASYYFLEKSEGSLQTFDANGNEVRKLLSEEEIGGTLLEDIYTPTIENSIDLKGALNSDDFKFPTSKTYHTQTIDKNEYIDIKLASIQLPEVVVDNGLDLPFKYDYTLVPCMSYGKLQHLAVSNTVDFSKLHAFNQSNFTTWKYRIDGDQLKLTFGADIFDTYEDSKVDGLVLEFYDLWGFAGSLEILDKKSYSGIFTKILTLNTLGTLSTKKIVEGGYTEDFHHNINIRNVDDAYKFNGDDVTFDSDKGWLDSSGNPITDNDCGTLYSNLLYGVKAYLRRTLPNGNKEFTKKREFFLYTLPIYNDYYYTINDFSALNNPQLDLVLTYKLIDRSNKEVYSERGIQNGYAQKDFDKINTYLQGEYNVDKSLSAIKYFKYKGTSDLYLEVGLKKDYQDLNISYSPDINKFFGCELLLTSNDSTERPYTVVSGNDVGNISQVLNYYNNGIERLNASVNKIEFANSASTSTTISKDDFITKNFINNVGLDPLHIDYEFVVGYNINITNIARDVVPATTICALYHQDPNGNYNEKDFGIYIVENENKKKEYLSNIMFYNDGTAEEEVFGICQQLSTKTGEDMSQQCIRITSITTDAQPIAREGLLNTGDPLKALVPYIGKLTFCQPHAHGLSGVNGVNIHKYNENDADSLGISSSDVKSGGFDYGSSGDVDGSKGITPRLDLFENPKYNMCLNTQKSINYFGEFISTLEYNEVTGRIWSSNYSNDNETTWHNTFFLRDYIGFTGEQLSVFNQKLLNTMSSVYAYNPDYDSLEVFVGDVQVVDNPVQFISNLISTNSKLTFDEGENLNNFIYLGPFKVSDYLTNLNIHSKISIFDSDSKLLPQIQFMPNYTYCGTPEQYYLISSLTYNTSTPQDIEAELALKEMNSVIVKHSDGTNRRMEGVPNTKTLYGYNSIYKKLVQLDVSNYNIDTDGKLTLTSDELKEYSDIKLENSDCAQILSNLKDGYTFTYQFEDSDKTEEVKINLKLNLRNVLKSNENHVYFASTSATTVIGIDATIDDKNYSINTENINLLCEYKGLDGTKFTVSGEANECSLLNLSLNDLDTLVSDNLQQITLQIGNTQPKEYYPSDLWKDSDADSHYVKYEGQGFTTSFDINNYDTLTFHPAPQSGNVIGLCKLSLQSIKLTLTRNTSIKDYPSDFVPVKPTEFYASRINHKYVVNKDYEQSRLRGTSMTLNDLVYVPNINGHRLFVKDGLCTYDDTHRGKIYYRYYRDVPEDGKYAHSSWNYADTKNLNCLFIYTGPCFITDNLYEQ